MSSLHRRMERKAELEAKRAADEAEQRRVAELNDYERIEEISEMWQAKAILHLFSYRIDTLTTLIHRLEQSA